MLFPSICFRKRATKNHQHQTYSTGFSEHASFFNFPVLKCSSVSQAKRKSLTIETQGRTVKWS